MRKMKYLLLACFITTAGVNAQEFSVNVCAEITEIVKNQQQEWNKGNIDGYMEAYWKSDSVMFITVKGITWGWNNVREKYLKAYPDQVTRGELFFEELECHDLKGGLVLMTGRWRVSRPVNNASGFFSLIWKKIDGKWRIIYDHTS